jgi:uncharacterized membrane protein YphA (DoxX/SURF4 family)
METAVITNEVVLAFVMRIILGILFFFQGYDKVINIKINGVIAYFKEELGGIQVPNFILVTAAVFTSFAELICGVLLIIGLFKTYTLFVLGVDLILVTAAFSLIKPMWDMQFVFPRLILLGILLLIPEGWDIISLDHTIWKGN